MTDVSHIGLCVTDLHRSLRFWCDGLGFETVAVHELGPQHVAALEVGSDDVRGVSQLVAKGGQTIELLAFDVPGVQGRPSTARNQPGFTHLALTVDDVDRVAAHLVSHGGQVLEGTRTTVDGPGGWTVDLLFLADPDGVRVELMAMHPPT